MLPESVHPGEGHHPLGVEPPGKMCFDPLETTLGDALPLARFFTATHQELGYALRSQLAVVGIDVKT